HNYKQQIQAHLLKNTSQKLSQKSNNPPLKQHPWFYTSWKNTGYIHRVLKPCQTVILDPKSMGNSRS
ncbi:MAG TPA: hypothetical protein VK205_18965, partial [Prolixibacteraceae bacterium]|nr:hypothetical protein [Prolixibacteraceae bacterium]